MSQSDSINQSPGLWNNPNFNVLKCASSSISSAQVFSVNQLNVNAATPFNISASQLINNIIHFGDNINKQINLPTVASVHAYLASSFNISSPPAAGFSFLFKVVNKSAANTVVIDSASNPGWQLNFSVGSTSTTQLTIPGATTREYTFIYAGSNVWQVAG